MQENSVIGTLLTGMEKLYFYAEVCFFQDCVFGKSDLQTLHLSVAWPTPQGSFVTPLDKNVRDSGGVVWSNKRCAQI